MQGTVKIISTFNSVTITVFDTSGNLIFINCCNEPYYTKKLHSKSYAMSNQIAFYMNKIHIDNVNVIVKGPGVGRTSSIKALIDNGIQINYIKDTTPIPHNGAIPMKRIRKKQ